MSCPFFKENYNFGFCGASELPYIPGIWEMEQQCFKDSFNYCANFDHPMATAHNMEIRENEPNK